MRPPDMLISEEARLIAVRTPVGIFAQQVSGAASFTRDSWLHYWGESTFRPFPNRGEAADGMIACATDSCLLRPVPGAKGILLVRGALHPEGCADVSVIVSAEPARRLCPRPWPSLVDRFTVWRDGATAVWLEGNRARIVTDRTSRGDRPWVPPQPVSRARTAPAMPAARTDTPAATE
jgi:competence protein ComEC